MAHPLQQRIAAVRRRLRLLSAAYGLGRLLIASAGTALLLGLADYALRIEDRGLRVLATVLWMGISGATAWRFLYIPLRLPLGDVDLARQLQRHFPVLGDNLASAVEFLRLPEDDPRAGSAALRRAVIHRTTAAASRLDFAEALEPRPVRRVLAAAGVMVVVIGGIAVAAPALTGVALARLLDPFGSTAWPQEYHLVVRNGVDRLARGQPLEIEVADAAGKPLPQQVRIYYRIEAPGGVLQEDELMRRFGQIASARRESVQHSFSYRVEGGDDRSMPWHRVEVLDPPEIQSLEITVVPPDYTRQPPFAGQRNLRLLAGSRLEMTALATKELAAATLCLEDGRQMDATLAADGRTFWLGHAGSPGMVVEQSGAYWFRLTDCQGLTWDTPRWDIRAVPDAPPHVVLEEPSGTLYVTPQAEVPIRIAVRDDLAIASVMLESTRIERSQAAAKPQGDGPEGEPAPAGQPPPKQRAEPPTEQGVAPDAGRPEPGTAWRAAAPRPEVTVLYPQPAESLGVQVHRPAAPEGESLVLSYRWALGALDLAPGTEVVIQAVASDFRPQAGRSQVRHLAIITPEELADRLAARQAALAAELIRAIDLERQARAAVEELRVRTGHMGRLDRSDLDRLRGAELSQRQVERVLFGPGEAVRQHVQGLLSELTNNKIDSPDIQRRMQAALRELDRLAKEELAAVAGQLGSVLKMMQSAVEEASAAQPADGKGGRGTASAAAIVLRELTAALGDLQENQGRALATLENLRDEFQRWDRVRRFHRDVAQLLLEQQELADRTAYTARRTFSKEPQDLTPQDRADLGLAAARQVDLAQRLERVQADMERRLPALRPVDSLAAEAVDDALRRLRDLRTSASMREAAEAVAANQIGLGLGLQREVIEQLRDVLDLLTNRREHELGRLLARLRQAESDLDELLQKQTQVRKTLETAAAQPEGATQKRELADAAVRQKALQAPAEELARRLEHLQAPDAAQAAAEAAQQMGQSVQAAAKAHAGAAAASARKAQQALDEARRRVAELGRQSQADLAKEQLSRLHEAVGLLHRRQQQILRRTEQLHTQQGAKTAPEGWKRELAELANQQKALASQTASLARKQVTSEAFAWALAGAEQAMSLSAAWLERGRVDDPAQSAQREALGRLGRLLESLRPAPPGQPGEAKPGPAPDAPAATPPATQPPASGASLRRLAELKLLRLIQEDLRQRTAELDQAVQAGTIAPDEARRQYHDISQQQGRLAELLLAIGASGAEEDPQAGQDSKPAQNGAAPQAPKAP